MPKVSIGDCSLYYEAHGSGEPLMLVPGLGGVGASFFKQIPELSRRYRVIVHDHRGCGQSDRPAMRYAMGQMTQDVLRLMDALGVEQAHFLGHSPGGARGQTSPGESPRGLKTLVLPPPGPPAAAFSPRLFEARHALLRHSGPM